jgi:hypothetical protein
MCRFGNHLENIFSRLDDFPAFSPTFGSNPNAFSK